MKRGRQLSCLVVSLVASQAASAQISPFSRPGQVLFDSMGFGYSVASEGELTGALYTELFPTDKVWLQVSDGRAIEWEPRVRINGPGFIQNWIAPSALQIEDAVVHACWADDKGQIYYRAMRPDQVGFEPILMLDNGQAGGGDVLSYEFAANSDQLTLLILSSADTGFDHDGDLFCVRSHDGGQSFSAAVAVSSADPGGADVVAAALALEGSDVYALWLDDRNDPGGELDLFLRHSTDGGASWTSPETRVNTLTGGLPPESSNFRPELHIASDRGRIVVAWYQTVTGPFAEVRSAWSDDFGATFSEQRMGSYPAGTTWAFTSDLREQAGAFLFVWRDGRSGTTKNYFTRSLDGGATWSTETPLPDVNASGDSQAVLGGEGMLVSAIYDSGFAGVFVGTLSRDGGATWENPVQFSQPGLARLLPAVLFNDIYSNFIHFWNDAPGGGDNSLHVGGFRPQTLTPMGFNAGATQVSFRLEGFPPADTSALILVSEAEGNLLLRDGRNLGLAREDLLALSLSNHGGTLAALQLGGSGTASATTAPLSSGQVLYCVAVGLREDGTPGAMTDVVPIPVP